VVDLRASLRSFDPAMTRHEHVLGTKGDARRPRLNIRAAPPTTQRSGWPDGYPRSTRSNVVARRLQELARFVLVDLVAHQ
jgi:hypothetical protein